MNTNTQTTAGSQAGLTLKAYRGDGSVMLAFDHYHFRAIQNQATQANPLQLQGNQVSGQEWWRPYYEPTNTKYHERILFVR
jgi:hypothetical protein